MMTHEEFIISGITLFMIVIATFFALTSKGDSNKKEKYMYKTCIGVLYGCSVVYFITKLMSLFAIPDICINLYACSIFALIYSNVVDKHNDIFLTTLDKKLSNKILDIESQIKIWSDKELFRPIKLFESNAANMPHEDFFIELVNYIIRSKNYIYEGESAINASMCLQAIMDRGEVLKQEIKINMILREYEIPRNIEDNKKEVQCLFATLWLLTKLSKYKYFNITVYKRKTQTAHYVNMTDDALLFSPFSKDVNGCYPLTYCYKAIENSFYSNFNDSMEQRLKCFESANNDYLQFFKIQTYAQKGYFGNKLKNLKNNALSMELLGEFFAPIIDQRINLYRNDIEKFKK